MSKRDTRGEGKALAAFQVLIDVEELLEMSAQQGFEFAIGRVDRLMDHASEPLAGLPHVGVVEQPEVHRDFVGAHFVLAKEKPRRLLRRRGSMRLGLLRSKVEKSGDKDVL